MLKGNEYEFFLTCDIFTYKISVNILIQKGEYYENI